MKLTCFPLGVKEADARGEDEEEEDQSGAKKEIGVVMTRDGRSKGGGVEGVGSGVGGVGGAGTVGSVGRGDSCGGEDGVGGGGNDRKPNHKYSSGCQRKENFKNVEEY